MVVLNLLKRSKKILLLFSISLFTALFLLFQSKNPPNDIDEILPNIGVTSPDLSQLDFLPESARPCTAAVPILIAFVHSSPSHIPHREAIRKTWGASDDHKIKTVFIVGRSQNQKIWQRVSQEAKEYKDVVIVDLLDSYKNLSLKHLAGIKWVLSNCPRVPYVLKSDDDTFIDTKRLLTILDILLGGKSGPKYSLICHVIPEGSSPKRSGKWTVTKEEYPYEEYPEYCSGLAYFTRISTLEKLSDTLWSGGVPYLTIDDVYVTGLSAQLAGVKRQDLGVRFATNEQPVIEWMSGKSMRPCPWMVVEMSSYYWPKQAMNLWNKTILAWKKISEHQSSG